MNKEFNHREHRGHREKERGDSKKKKLTTENTDGFFNSKGGIINLTTENTEDTERKNKEIQKNHRGHRGHREKTEI